MRISRGGLLKRETYFTEQMLPMVLGAYVLLWYAILRANFGILISDDAFITLSHARTWIETGLPVMSVHNPVNAATSPLYTALLAAIGACTRAESLECIAFLLCIPLDLVGMILLFRITETLTGSSISSLIAMAAYGMSVGTLAAGASGLETTLFTTATIIGIYLIHCPLSPWYYRVVLLLLLLIRPECLLTAAIMVGVDVYRTKNRNRLLLNMLSIMISLGMSAAFFFWSYGHPLPHSMVAKSAFMKVSLSVGVRAWLMHGFLKGPVWGGFRTSLIVNILLTIVALWGIIKSADRRLLPTAIWLTTYVAFYLVTGKADLNSPWYFSPAIPFAIVLIVFGCHTLTRQMSERRSTRWFLPAILITWFGVMTIGRGMPATYRSVYESREMRYREAAEQIAKESGESETIMIDEVGALAFHSRRRILDSHGLLSPEVLPYVAHKGDYRRYMGLMVNQFKPDWIVATWPTHVEHRIEGHEALIFGQYDLYSLLGRPGNHFALEVWRRKERDRPNVIAN